MLLLLVAVFSGVGGFGVGWALSRPHATGESARIEPVSAPTAPAAVASSLGQGMAISAPALAPETAPPAELRAPASAQAPVISPAIALTEPLKPVLPPSEARPDYPAPRRPRLASAALFPDAMPPSHAYAVDPLPAHQQPYVYVSPILATMGDVTVQISPASRTARASLIP